MTVAVGSVVRSTPPRAGLAFRLIRGGLLAAATLGVAVWAHASADGNLPGTAGLIVIWALSTVVAAVLLARPASVRRVTTMSRPDPVAKPGLRRPGLVDRVAGLVGRWHRGRAG